MPRRLSKLDQHRDRLYRASERFKATLVRLVESEIKRAINELSHPSGTLASISAITNYQTEVELFLRESLETIRVDDFNRAEYENARDCAEALVKLRDEKI